MRKGIKSENIYSEDIETGELILLSSVKYNIEGKEIWRQNLFRSGEIQSEHEYSYESGILVKEISWSENGDSHQIYYDFNELGQQTSIRTKFSDNTEELIRFTYSKEEEISEYFDSEGILYQKEIKQIDENKFPIQSKVFQENELIEEHFYKNDLKGNVIEKRSIEHNEFPLTSITFYEYDSNDNLIEELEKNEEGIILSKLSYLFKDDQLVKETYNDFEESLEKIIGIHEYDKQGKVTRSVESDGSGNLKSEFKFLYNENGDLIQTISVQGLNEHGERPRTEIEKFEIEYY